MAIREKRSFVLSARNLAIAEKQGRQLATICNACYVVLRKTNKYMCEDPNFYIDMRTPGKGYEEFYKRLLAEDVHFIRGKCAEITDVPETPEEEGKLVVVGEDTLLGMTRRVPVDMVILSSVLQPQKDADEVARKISLSCAQGGFFLEKHPKLAPVEAFSDGIYLAGACQGPKDIPHSVAQGAAAAACALSLCSSGVAKQKGFEDVQIYAEIDGILA